MFKFVVLACILAVAAAKPGGLLTTAPIAYSTVHSPIVHSPIVPLPISRSVSYSGLPIVRSYNGLGYSSIPLSYSSGLGYSSPLGYTSPLSYTSPLAYHAPLGYHAPLAYHSPLPIVH